MTAKKFTQAEVDELLANAAAAAAPQSKPHLVGALRSTWRKSGQHYREQVIRFVRLFVVSAIPVVTSAVMSGSHFDKKTLLALLVPVVETVYRQIFPALGAQAADDAPGVTIVPEQVEQTEGDAAP